ncbi:hypothetical protein V2O64_09890 [Verrucomicrobiaceae bacterium 227]
MSEFRITSEKRTLFNGTVLLGHMAGRDLKFDILLPGSHGNLEPILSWLLTRDLIEISPEHHYQVSTLGHATVAAFERRYRRLLQYFDVFSAVDLGSGEFALAYFENFQNDTSWQQFLSDERWEDLRVPVAQFLGGDPVEFVFAHFMREGRFDFEKGGWEITLLEGLIWTEIEQICWSSLEPDDLGYDDVRGEDVLAEVIEQGLLLARTLSDHEPELMAHLARWAPSRQAPEWKPDSSTIPFWKTRWNLDLA